MVPAGRVKCGANIAGRACDIALCQVLVTLCRKTLVDCRPDLALMQFRSTGVHPRCLMIAVGRRRSLLRASNVDFKRFRE